MSNSHRTICYHRPPLNFGNDLFLRLDIMLYSYYLHFFWFLTKRIVFLTQKMKSFAYNEAWDVNTYQELI
jgi:hypothetical protein